MPAAGTPPYQPAVLCVQLDPVLRTFLQQALNGYRLTDSRILNFMSRIRITPNAEFDAMGNAFRYATLARDHAHR